MDVSIHYKTMVFFFSFLFSVLWCSQIGSNNTYGYFASFGYKPDMKVEPFQNILAT
jgi:hypothetical protein